MRVLHISSPKTWRGGEQQLMYLVDELKKLGVWQVVMCPFNSEVHKYCLKHHLNHVTYFKRFSANPMVAFRVSHVCKREKIDLVHVHDSHAHNFAVLSAVLTNNELPIVVSRRVDFPVQGTPMSAFKYNHQRIKKIICVSDAIRNIMDEFIEEKSKLTVVHSGVDLDKFDQPVGRKLRDEYQLDDRTVLIGNVAALAPHKDYPTFIRTAKQVIDQGVNAKFLAIGDGPSRKEVENAIEEMGMEEHVILTGFRKDIIHILPELDLFLITSKTEGLGTSILDAQVAGVPVVATNAGGIGEIIEHERNGLLCPVGDDVALAREVIRMINEPLLRTSFSQTGKEMAKAFSKSETARKTERIYQEVLRSSGDSADSE